MMPELVLLSGIPGSGKTFFFKNKLAENNLVRLCMNDYREWIMGKYYFKASEPIVMAWMDTTGRYLIKEGVNICIDGTNLRVYDRRKWVNIAKDYGYRCVLYSMMVPREICYARNASRDRSTPIDVIDRMYDKAIRPSYDEGWDVIYEVNKDMKIEEVEK